MADALHVARATAILGGNGFILLTLFNAFVKMSPQSKHDVGAFYGFFSLIALLGLWRAYVALGRRANGKHDQADNDEFLALMCFLVPVAVIVFLMLFAAAIPWSHAS